MKNTLVIHRALLNWYNKNKRDLPWRKNNAAYRVWLSEIMLQQTRVEAVIPYYELFLSHFPTVQDLAAATEDKVMNLWAGLGYYSRARNLHAAAKKVVTDFNGIFPLAPETLITLPGVGCYTSNAIASIAGNASAAAVDGNLERVISRLLALKKNPKKEGRNNISEFANALTQLGQAGFINQAFMDLASRFCLPKNPKCGECPLKKQCLAQTKGIAALLPVRSPKKERVLLRAEGAVLLAGSELLLFKRPRGMWLEGVTDIPWWTEKEKSPKLPWESQKKISQLRHITNHKIEFSVRTYNLKKRPSLSDLKKIFGPLTLNAQWVNVNEMAGLNLPRPTERALEQLIPGGMIET